MVMSRDQNAGRNHNIKLDNSSFERVEQFKYLGKILMNKNPIQVEIKTGRGVTLTPHPFQCRGHERVELYLYSSYGPYGLYRASVPVQ
jgi:hypothetical protein